MTIEQKIDSCPIVFHWCEYKGEPYFGALNYQKSVEQNRVIIDLHYCATAALNNSRIEKVVAYSKKNFEMIEQ